MAKKSNRKAGPTAAPGGVPEGTERYVENGRVLLPPLPSIFNMPRPSETGVAIGDATEGRHRDNNNDPPGRPGQCNNCPPGKHVPPNGDPVGSSGRQARGFGYVPDLSDRRDYEYGQLDVGQLSQHAAKAVKTVRADDAVMLARYQAACDYAFVPAVENQPARTEVILPAPPQPLPARVDLRPFMPPVENQWQLQICSACAVGGMLEYQQIISSGGYVALSRLFMYKNTRDLLGWSGDGGVYLRTLLKTIALTGACPDEYWPLDPARVDDMPTAFCFSVAQSCRSIHYVRLSGLDEIKKAIARGLPVAMGFTCYESIDAPDVAATGRIPFPVISERTLDGHAVLAVGYVDDARGSGYLIVRNSWGVDWGVQGYGLLPYEYVSSKVPLSEDYWTLVLTEFPHLPGSRAPLYAMTDW